jgi:hypothetical protein
MRWSDRSCVSWRRRSARACTPRATLEEAHALLGLHRDAEALAAADLASRALLDGRTASLSAFTTRYERELYLTAVDYKARALAATHDDEAILALCEPVVRDIEAERARVSSPYQQSAFLATRAEIYEFVAAAAYRTGKLDTVLRTSELLKSRALAASRLRGDPDADLEAQYRHVNEAIRDAAGGEAHDLRERREWLATARAIARARGRTHELPDVSIAAVQAALADDTAAVTWFFAGEDVLVVLAIRRDGTRPAVIRLDPTVIGQLRDYLACVTALAQPRPNYKRLVPRIDELVAALGSVLLPANVRDFIAGTGTLLLSPHRSLHLFPFHAAPWSEGDATRFLIERFRVRYIPNLTSLLLPWDGNREGPVLAVGVGRFDDVRAPALPNAAREARAVARAHGASGHALIDPTIERFLSLPPATYRCLHFATHGSSVLAGTAVDDPLQACIYFRDGPLTAWDVSALPLRAELAVLAACHSGQRAIAGRGLARLPGDDLLGLAGAFFEAGVACVLGTLWPVHDETAKALVVAFHESYARGTAPAVALADAVRDHLRESKQARDVFFWAPFFVSSLGRMQPA